MHCTIYQLLQNACKTLAKRHQIRPCWELEADELLQSRCVNWQTKPISLDSEKLSPDVKSIILDKLLQRDADSNKSLVSFHNISVDHVNYKVGCIYVIQKVEAEDVPIFQNVRYTLSIRNTTFERVFASTTQF